MQRKRVAHREEDKQGRDSISKNRDARKTAKRKAKQRMVKEAHADKQI